MNATKNNATKNNATAPADHRDLQHLLINKVYFAIYETRHYGWVGEMITQGKAREHVKDEDNMDIYVCYTYSPVAWTDVILLVENPMEMFPYCFEPWSEHEVTATITQEKLNILSCRT